MYDYLVVGSGLYGAIFAHEAKAHGKSVLVVDKRPNIAGNIYTENIEGNYADLDLNQSGQYGQIYAEKFTSVSLICKVFYGKMKAQ